MTNGSPFLTSGEHVATGAVAEILSVVEESAIWRHQLNRPVSLEALVAALDTNRPAEERVAEALAVCRKLKAAGRIARWLPWYDRLFEHEYRQEFFVGYRDHSIHTLQVLLLGLYLFETVSSLRDLLMALLRRKVSDVSLSEADLFVEWWLLTGLWHDSAYAFEAESFLADRDLRGEILNIFNRTLGVNPFSEGIAAAGITLTYSELRQVYQKGSYYPLEIQSISQLISSSLFKEIGQDLWHRLGIGLGIDDVSKELDLLTTQDPAGRPPYHDHGITGAALLATFIEEAQAFLSTLAGGDGGGATGSAVKSTAEEAWLDFALLEGVIAMAIEAIAFHNVTFSQLRASRSAARLISEDYDTQVSLAQEPHLFFTAVADTLQDWDRHHFVASGPGTRYQPSTSAKDILIQGDGDRLRVSLKGDTHASETVIRLFSGWLNNADVTQLFADHPEFSLPHKLEAGVPTVLDRFKRSQVERLRLEQLIRSHTVEAKRVLIEDKSDSVLRASTLFHSITRQISEATVLTHSDKEAVEAFLEDSGLRRVQAQSYALIGEGCRLQLGEVVRRIGEGGFGRVFEVRGSAGAGKSAAFKVFHDHDLGNAEKLRLFRRGYEAMRSLSDHPNVVSVFSFSEVPLGFFMEFVPGPDLEQGIGHFDTVHDRLTLGLKVVNAVADAHNRPVRVLHRDIKPANVLLDSTRDFEPVLTDFDLAWIESRRTTLTRQLYANFHYGAPEQFEERWREYRERPAVDVYALGALLYFLLLKQAPPHWSDWGAPHWALVEDRLGQELTASAVERIVRLLENLTVANPSDRLTSVDRVAAELTRIVALAVSGNRLISENEWRQEVVYRCAGKTVFSPEDFPSRPGNVQWRLAVSSRRASKLLVVVATCGLAMKPVFEGVNYQQYRLAVARRLDERLRSFAGLWPGVEHRRTSFPTENSRATIRLEGLPCTLEAAAAFGQLLVQINHAIEA